MRRWPWLGYVGAGMLGVLLLVAVAAPLLAPYDPALQVAEPFARPSWAHPLGANDIGQDILSEVIFGARVSLAVGITAALVATVLGTCVGLTAGYVGGRLDAALMRVCDVTLSLPFVPLAIVIAVFAGPGLVALILIIPLQLWAEAARKLRAQVLAVSRRDAVRAVEAMGASRAYVLRRHLLPLLTPIVIPQFVRAAIYAIVLEASLSFLGLGDATIKSWGTILSYANARSAFLTDSWLWWIVPPGLCIAAAGLSFAFIGYALEERGRPRLHALAPAWRRPRSAAPAADSAGAALLRITDLTVRYGASPAVHGVSLDVRRGEILGVVGSSGSGKSTMAGAIMGLLKAPARVDSGRVLFHGEDLLDASPARLLQLRGGRLALVPQAAMNALNPVLTVGAQIVEAIRLHRPASRQEAYRHARELLERVGIDAVRAGGYPHELSGGMRQRVLIAMALANDPELIIVDEPTTGLDPLIQHGILQLLTEVSERLGAGIVLISHDLAVVAEVADTIAVMNAGRIVEFGPAASLLQRPRQAYTQRLLTAALPRRGQRRYVDRSPLLQVSGVSKSYPRAVAAVGVDLDVREGEIVGLIGQSGAGKSTLARLILRLERPDEGRILFGGTPLEDLSRRDLRSLHLVFQDPYQSLPDHLRVGEIVAEPLRIHGEKAGSRVGEALKVVGLDPSRYRGRYPSQLSGGERQRVALARAAVVRPRLIVLDEPTSMLDAELRQELLAALLQLRDQFGVSYLCITHDLVLARAFCDRLVVLREGHVVEAGPTEVVTSNPTHPYTEMLVRTGLPANIRSS